MAVTWNKTDWYCPKCGVRDVWIESGDGDYYAGPSHICNACESEFSLPYNVTKIPDEGIDRDALKVIRAAKR